MNKSMKKTFKKSLVILLAVVTMVGFGMPGLSYFDASGSMGIYSFCGRKDGRRVHQIHQRQYHNDERRSERKSITQV